jgi:hypothetical protein
MKNQLIDLNNHLFAQLERLGDEELTGDALNAEIKRAKAMANVGRQVIDNARLALDAHKLEREYGGKGSAPAMLGVDK